MRNAKEQKLLLLASKIWEYLALRVECSDFSAIIVLGSEDNRVADCAYSKFVSCGGCTICCSGGVRRASNGELCDNGLTEAERFAQRLIQCGVPEKYIVRECESQNTSENIKKSMLILENRLGFINGVQLLHKSYACRRAYYTASSCSPHICWGISYPEISLKECFIIHNLDIVLSRLVGEVARIIKYSQIGYFAAGEIPEDIITAYTNLHDLGYSACLPK